MNARAGGTAALLFCLLVPLRAAADSTVDDVEHLFGATNVNAALGDGRLSVGVARTGEVTVLRWPGPGSPDHLRYATRVEADRTKTARSLPRFGAARDMGMFFGMRLGEAASFFHEAPWRISQAYAGPDSPVLATRFVREGGPMAVQEDFVVWKKDVLVRRLRVSGLTGPVRLIAYAALAPCATRTAELPFDDWAFDEPQAGGAVDFALFYSPRDDAFVSFRPDKDRAGQLRQAAAEAVARARPGGDAADAEIAGLDSTFGEGFYLAWGADVASTARAASVMSFAARPSGLPQPAFEDSLDAELAGEAAALAPAAGAMTFDLLPSNGEARLSVMLAAGSSAAGALSVLREAKRRGAVQLQKDAELAWSELIGRLTMPDTGDLLVLAVSKRAAMSIVGATDPPSGAIVASITTQPPYAENWPRDSAFINYTLERAGLADMATANNRFLAKVQRKSEQPGRPEGSFAMNYYPDGRPGGPIPFEIDNAAFAVWTFVEHAEFLESWGRRPEAASYRREIYPAVQRAANLLATCKDERGLQCPANEDDRFEVTQTLHGAATVLLAMESAARLARGMDQLEDADRWSSRAAELKAAIFAHLVDSSGMLAGDRGARAWALWPVGIFPPGDERIAAEADRMLEDLERQVGKATAGSAYDAKLTGALAKVLPAEDRERRARLGRVIESLLREVPTETWHYGEVFSTADLDGDGNAEFDNRVAMPHVWEATINYLSAMQFYGERKPGCGCGAGGGPLLAGAALVLGARRRPLRQ
ncbi:MAG: hypothetical protein HYZ28_26490 [Myxococcales bacterium]|nr:hypothetical protein [Myxococcales bacterium]